MCVCVCGVCVCVCVLQTWDEVLSVLESGGDGVTCYLLPDWGQNLRSAVARDVS